MIITVTPNPSVDRAFDLDRLEVGEVNRALRTHLDAGGKGINVSRGLNQNGVETVAVFPIGGPDGPLLVSELEAVGVPVHPVRVSGSIRSNITLADADGDTTKINAPGPVLDESEQGAILAAVAEHLDGARYVVAAGSLPTGVSPDFVIRLGRLAASGGVAYALDTSGAPLEAALRAGGCAIAKPNDLELAELVGRELLTVGEVRDAAREIISWGNDAVLVSLGAHGALLVTATGCWWAGGDPIVPRLDRRSGRLDVGGVPLRRRPRARAVAYRGGVGPRRRPAPRNRSPPARTHRRRGGPRRRRPQPQPRPEGAVT